MMLFNTVRFKITIFYMIILAVTLSLFSFLLYQNFNSLLFKNIDNLLASRAKGATDAIDTYWEMEIIEAKDAGAVGRVFTKDNNENFIKIAKKWMDDKTDDPKLLNTVIQIFNTKGEDLASSKNIPEIGKLPRKAFLAALSGQENYGEVNIETSMGRPATLRTLTIPVRENGKIVYILQVGMSVSTINSALNNLILVILILLPLTVILTGVFGYLLARVALSPVDDMIHTIHQITADNLKLRVKIPDTKDEIKRLADTFNEMLEKLDKSFSMERQFAEDMSHELKTPLSIIKGEMEVTLKKLRSKKEYEEVLKSSIEEVNRITKIVENLLTLAKLNSKFSDMKQSKIDLKLLLEAVLGDLKVIADKKAIKLEFYLQNNIFVLADESQLRRLFLNLLDNALKYTEENGKVTVRLRRVDKIAQITVSDSGIGISKADLPHIFERYYRVRNKKENGGFGLGLNISKAAAEANNGSISVKSILKKGTTFKITFPVNNS